MECPSASKCVATDRCYNKRDRVRNDIRVDAKRKYQRVLEDTSGRRSARTCAFFRSGSVFVLCKFVDDQMILLA